MQIEGTYADLTILRSEAYNRIENSMIKYRSCENVGTVLAEGMQMKNRTKITLIILAIVSCIAVFALFIMYSLAEENVANGGRRRQFFLLFCGCFFVSAILCFFVWLLAAKSSDYERVLRRHFFATIAGGVAYYFFFLAVPSCQIDAELLLPHLATLILSLLPIIFLMVFKPERKKR